MKQIAKMWIFIERFIPGFIFVSIFLVMLMEIFCRKFFTHSLSWSSEYSRYALVWVTFTGTAFVRRNDLHIKVDALYDYFNRRGWTKLSFAIDFAISILAILYWCVLVYFGWLLASRTSRIRASSMDISMFWLYIPTCIGGLLAGIVEIVDFIKLLSGKKRNAGAVARIEEAV